MSVERYVWEPKNGTRYELAITRFEGRLFGCPDGGWIVVGPYADHIRALVVPSDSGLHWSRVAERMGVGEVDASCVAVMVGAVAGIKVWPSEAVLERVKVPFDPTPAPTPR